MNLNSGWLPVAGLLGFLPPVADLLPPVAGILPPVAVAGILPPVAGILPPVADVARFIQAGVRVCLRFLMAELIIWLRLRNIVSEGSWGNLVQERSN